MDHGAGARGGVDARRGDTDPLDEWDEERWACPVGRTEDGAWRIHGHPEALAVLLDHDTYGNRVSPHVAIPNGMDPPEHGRWRAIVDRYFGAEDMAAFEPACRRIAAELVDELTARRGGEVMGELAEPFAVRAQCAFMGWPDAVRETLLAWQEANHRATRARDRDATAAVATAFEDRVGAILSERRAMGAHAPDDPTTRLLRERIDDRPLTDAEIVGIVRTWTVGELGSIAAGIGIVLHALANDAALQERLRSRPELAGPATDEILRARGPLVANRRVAMRDTDLGGQRIEAGDRLTILWPSANRDERVHPEPDVIRVERDPATNLLYGAGIHVCPGAPLARLELRIVTEEVLRRTSLVEIAGPTAFAQPPKGGFDRVPLRLHP